MSGKIKRVFPGGNTSQGFVSYYDYIIEKDANRIFIIKGGPGTGKSSMMKKIGEEMLDRGYDVEYHHCSSDNNSIDGIVIPKLRVAMIDGTAPHVVDPKNPGAVDEIIHLGDYWNLEKMEENKIPIIYYTEKNSKFYRRAYKYLAAARLIQEDISWKVKECVETGQINVEIYSLIDEIFEDIWINPVVGKDRHLFGSAYSPSGWIEYTDTLLYGLDKVYHITGEMGTGKSHLLKKISDEALVRGLDVEVYHTPLIPDDIETVIIKDLNIALTISEMAQDFDCKNIDLNQYINKEEIEKCKQDIEEDKKMFDNLIQIAINDFKAAKTNHDFIEQYYIGNMDFDAIEEVTRKIIQRILSYEE